MRLFSSGTSHVICMLVRREVQPSELRLNSVSLFQLIASTSPSGPNWLLFSNSSVLLEHLLADIYIPFDCEFLVAREDSKGGISLFEVYRVNRTAPLRSRLLAVGSQTSSLSWDNRSLYERRNDLFGATIRAASSQVMVPLIIIIIIIIIIITIIFFFICFSLYTTRASPVGIPRDIYSLLLFFFFGDGTIVCWFCSLSMVTESGHFSIVPVAYGRCFWLVWLLLPCLCGAALLGEVEVFETLQVFLWWIGCIHHHEIRRVKRSASSLILKVHLVLPSFLRSSCVSPTFMFIL